VNRAPASEAAFPGGRSRSPSPTELERAALIVFACLNTASIGVFFIVFVGLLFWYPEPRATVFLLTAGSMAFATLVMAQFVWWSRLALCALSERRK
jgi:hypothetical protein